MSIPALDSSDASLIAVLRRRAGELECRAVGAEARAERLELELELALAQGRDLRAQFDKERTALADLRALFHAAANAANTPWGA